MSKLPHDIIIEILSRLPVKPLIRFKCVSKSWCALINDPQFAKLQLRRIEEDGDRNRILLSDWPPLSVDYETFRQGKNNNAISELHYPPMVKGPPSFFTILGSCNGLTCILDADNMVLWNPSTRDYKELPKSSGSAPHYCYHGLGFDECNNDYCLVLATEFTLDHSEKNIVELFTLKTNSWRRIQDDSLAHIIDGFGTFWNGALHWLGCEDKSYVIVSFDMAEKKFKKVLPSPPPDHLDTYNYALDLGTSENGLCLFSARNRDCFEAFAMNVQSGYGDSWTRVFNYPLDRFPGYGNIALHLTNTGEVVFNFDGWQSALYNPKEGSMRYMTSNNWECDAQIYVESLISPNYVWT